MLTEARKQALQDVSNYRGAIARTHARMESALEACNVREAERALRNLQLLVELLESALEVLGENV